MPVVQATQKAEAAGSQSEASPGKVTYLKKKLKRK
jgi:hypothetical protein